MNKVYDFFEDSFPFLFYLGVGFLTLGPAYAFWYNLDKAVFGAWLLLFLLPIFSIYGGCYFSTRNVKEFFGWVIGMLTATLIPLLLSFSTIQAAINLNETAKLYVLLHYGWGWMPLLLGIILALYYLIYHAPHYLPRNLDRNNLQKDVKIIALIMLGNISLYLAVYFIPWFWPIFPLYSWLIPIFTTVALFICITGLFKSPRYFSLWVFLACAWMAYSAMEWLNGLIAIVVSPYSFLDKLESVPYEPRLMIHTIGFLCGFMILLTVFRRSAFVSAIAERRLKRLTPQSDTFGKADFESEEKLKEIAKGEEGVIVGQIYEDPKSPLLPIPLEGHVITIAPPRAGKLTSALSPNLATYKKLGWSGPSINLDVKGEMVAVWGEHRADNLDHVVYVIDPFGVLEKLGCKKRLVKNPKIIFADYNPLSEIAIDSSMVRHVDALTDALVTPPPSNSSPEGEHFYDCAKRVTSGFIAWTIEKAPKDKKNLSYLTTLLNQNQKDFMQMLNDMLDSDCGFGLPQDAASLLLKVDMRERGSILSTTTNALSFLKYPEIKEHIKKSDFSLKEILNGRTDIFIVMPPDLLKQIRSWTRIWVTLPLDILYQNRPAKRVLLNADEISPLGRIDGLKKAFNLGPGFGFSIWVYAQHFNDIIKEYGLEDAEGMLGMAQIVQFFNISPTDYKTQEIISKLCGTKTVITENATIGQGQSDASGETLRKLNSDNQTRGSGESKRPLINPEEVAQLPGNGCLVFAKKNNEPIRPMKIFKADYRFRQEFDGLHKPNPYHIKPTHEEENKEEDKVTSSPKTETLTEIE